MAFRQWKKNSLWIWRAINGVSRRAIAWQLGDRSDADLSKLIKRVDHGRCDFVTDEWGGFFRCLSDERRHFYGKDLTFPIEGTNSDIRHRLARFKRKTKASSRSIEMVDLSLKLFHYFQDHSQNVTAFMTPLLSFFS
jgi:insertion element IS1 protein InsB